MSLGIRSNKLTERGIRARIHTLVFYLMMLALIVPGLAGCAMHTSRESAMPAAIIFAAEKASPYRFVPGERLIYKLNYSGASASDFTALFAGQEASNQTEQAPPLLANSFNVTVQGELSATVIGKKDEGVLMAYSLRNPSVRLIANGQDAQTEAEAIKTNLGRDVFAVVSPHGRVLSVRFDPATGNLPQSFARSLLAITQVVFSSAKPSALDQWETQEDDPNGQYIARYKMESGKGEKEEANLRTIRKTKSRYVKSRKNLRPDEFDAPTKIIPKGELIARFDMGEGHLVSLNGTESQVIEIAGRTIAHADSSIRIDYAGKEALNASELSALQSASDARARVAAAVPLSANASDEVSEANIHRTELGDATLDSLLSDLARLGAMAEEDSSLYLKFKALVYLHPETSASLGRIIATADSSSPAMNILTGALSSIGHAEAQAALVSAIESRKEDWHALAMLIPALSAASSPIQPAENTLRDLAFNSSSEEISSTAKLALGMMAARLAQASPERATSIVDLFLKRLESSESTDEKNLMLLALGNGGSLRALSAITRYMKDPSPVLRGAAASALRFIESDRVEGLLIRALASDAEANVRLEAAASLGFRQMSGEVFKAQKKAFLTDKDDNVRLTLLSNLWRAQEEFPEVRQMVKRAAASDHSEKVRKAATEIIEMYSNYFDK